LIISPTGTILIQSSSLYKWGGTDLDDIPFLIKITFGDLTGGLDDVTKALHSVDATADLMALRNPESITGQLTLILHKGSAAARAFDEAQIKHARRELLFIPTSDEGRIARVKRALSDAGIAVDMEIPLNVEPKAHALGVSKLAEAREVCHKLGVLEGLPAAPETGLTTPVMPDGTHVMPDIPQPEPATVEGYIRRGVMRDSKGDLSGAIADFDSALRLNPESAEAFANRGYTRENLADLAGAVDDFSEAIRLKPEYAGVYGNRGGARMQLGDLVGSIEDFSKAIQLNPKDVLGFINRGGARAKLGDLAGAIEDFSEAIRLNPQTAIGYFNRGHTKQDQGDLTGAIADYDEAIRLNPDFFQAYAKRATVRAKLGDNAGAETDFQKYRELAGRK
jgi:Tfp pilus assembly protein PilF